MAGLIQSALDEDLVKPVDMLDAGQVAQAGSVGYDANTRTVDAGKETVAGQMDTLLNAESPYLTRARTRAAQTANSRGLLNSSIAAGAGEAAAIDASLPIASQDASIYGTASRDNQLATNQASQFGASETNTTTRQNAASMNQAGQAKLAAELETGLIGTRAGAESTLQAERAVQERGLTELRGQLEQQLQTLRGGQAEMLAGIESNYKTLIQANASAGSFFSDVTKSMSLIMANVDTSPEQKQAAVDKLGAMLRSGLSVIGAVADIDLAGLLDFSTP